MPATTRSRGFAAPRTTRHLGPLVVCLAVALAMMSPYAGDRLAESPAGDLAVHVSGVIDARNAIFEGQFPIRVAPSHAGGLGGTALGPLRYPLFQFYGNFPYTAGGLLYAAGLDPYSAWKLVQCLALAAGGFFVYLAARRATWRPRVSTVAAVVFMTAPYMWTDLHARFAFTEFVSFNLLPAAFYFVERTLASPRIRHVLLGGVAWALLAMSHNVTYLYASAFFGLYVLSTLLPWRRRSPGRALRAGAAYALGVLLVLWYVVPQLHSLNLLSIRVGSGSVKPVGAELLTPLNILLSPLLKTPPASNTPNLGLQVGWMILAAAVLAVVTTLAGRRTATRARSARVLALFAVSLFMTWSPVDFWQFLPSTLAYVQSSYRLLMFVTLFGALLTAYGLHALLPRRGRRDLPWPATVALVGLTAAAVLSYVPDHKRLGPRALPALIAKPTVSGNRDYLVAGPAAMRASFAHPDVDWAEPIRGVVPQDGRFVGRVETRARAPREGGTVELAGTVPAHHGRPAVLTAQLDGKPLHTGQLPPGNFELKLTYPGPLSREDVPLVLSAEWAGGAGLAEVVVQSLRFTAAAPEPGQLPFIPAVAAAKETIHGRVSEYTREIGDAALVELPMLWYPGLLRVTRGGKDVPYGHVGRLLAVPVPAGRYRVKVTFAGVAWANTVSAVGWVGVVAMLAVMTPAGAWLAWRSRRRWRRTGSPSAFSSRPAIGWLSTAAVPSLILAAFPVHRLVTHKAPAPFECTATTSRASEVPERDGPANAFDADDSTAWSVPGGVQPVTLTIVPARPAEFRRITLLARESGLVEAWHKVGVDLQRSGQTVLAQDFELPTADKEALQVLNFAPTRADRIVMTFSEAVTLTRDGVTRVDLNACSPGYREIRFE